MQQIDTPENTTFVYLYCNSFTWLNPLENEQYGGHPKEKTIYRAWFNTETKSYRIVLNPGIGTYFKNLKETDTFPQGYVCDFEEVTKYNILKFKIEESNLQDLLMWLQYDNADLKERLGFTSPPTSANNHNSQVIAIVQNPEAHQEQVRYQNALRGFLNSGEELLHINPVAFEKIWDLIDIVLNETYSDEPMESYQLKMSNQGLGINISDTYKSLSRYTSTDRRTNENPDDLYEAMAHILTELIRRDYNNLDQ